MGELAAVLRHSQRVGLDTSIFIYHLEGSSRYAPACGSVFDDLARGGFETVTSVLTLMELTVKPLRLGRSDIANEYEVLVANYPNLTITDIDQQTARRAASLRAVHRLQPADALQVAVCAQVGAAAFLTNNRDLRRVTEVPVLLLEEFVTD